MILLAFALLLQAQGVPAQQGESQPTAVPPPQAQPAQTQAVPKPYSGPHTLAKTWGDLYPGLRTPSRPAHQSGAVAKTTANPAVAASRPAAQPGKSPVATQAGVNRAAVSGNGTAKATPGPGAGTLGTTKPVTSASAANASSQLTFYNGSNKTGDGRVDVMHFRDGKMAVTMGKDWNCSYADDEQQHRVVIICDGQRSGR